MKRSLKFKDDKQKNIAGLNGFDIKGNGKIGYRQKILRFIGLLPKVGNARYLDWGHGTPHWEDGILMVSEIVIFN